MVITHRAGCVWAGQAQAAPDHAGEARMRRARNEIERDRLRKKRRNPAYLAAERRRNSKRMRARRHAFVQQGRCSECGVKNNRPNRWRCDDCAGSYAKHRGRS
jgi:hypothetical protein